MLVVSCTSGLCNRIHAILGSKILAHKLGRDFSVYWPRNGELDLSFQAKIRHCQKLFRVYHLEKVW